MIGRRWSRCLRIISIALVMVLLSASVALAAVTIYENRGVGAARLGWYDRSCISKLGRVTRSGRDRSYTNQVVYYFYFGSRMSNRKYPLEMYSNRRHKVFTFVANSSRYVTRKGIHVGSRESTLRSRYGSSLRRYRTSTYTRYTLGSRPGTDFWVKGGYVRKIVVRTY